MFDDGRPRLYAPVAAMTEAGTTSSGDVARGPVVRSRTADMQGTDDEFRLFVAEVRGQIDAYLEPWLNRRVADARHHGADVEVAADAVRQLVMRGGKRLRAVLVAAAYEACQGHGGARETIAAGASLELLQAYLLVHDDWMDGDALRRGGPSVPAMMRERFTPARADAMSILAGDLAAAWAQRALLEVDLPAPRVLFAARELARMQEDVTHGQILDVAGAARDMGEVEKVHALKSASYSVRGPVRMGAHLAGADEATLASLAAFCEPLGVAFQLRDDVLGVFGEASAMGKAAGGDLVAGKRTALVVEALRDDRAASLLARVHGRTEATPEEVRAAVAAIDACGARARVERRIAELVGESREALERATLTPSGRRLLLRAAQALTERNI